MAAVLVLRCLVRPFVTSLFIFGVAAAVSIATIALSLITVDWSTDKPYRDDVVAFGFLAFWSICYVPPCFFGRFYTFVGPFFDASLATFAYTAGVVGVWLLTPSWPTWTLIPVHCVVTASTTFFSCTSYQPVMDGPPGFTRYLKRWQVYFVKVWLPYQIISSFYFMFLTGISLVANLSLAAGNWSTYESLISGVVLGVAVPLVRMVLGWFAFRLFFVSPKAQSREEEIGGNINQMVSNMNSRLSWGVVGKFMIIRSSTSVYYISMMCSQLFSLAERCARAYLHSRRLRKARVDPIVSAVSAPPNPVSDVHDDSAPEIEKKKENEKEIETEVKIPIGEIVGMWAEEKVTGGQAAILKDWAASSTNTGGLSRERTIGRSSRLTMKSRQTVTESGRLTRKESGRRAESLDATDNGKRAESLSTEFRTTRSDYRSANVAQIVVAEKEQGDGALEAANVEQIVAAEKEKEGGDTAATEIEIQLDGELLDEALLDETPPYEPQDPNVTSAYLALGDHLTDQCTSLLASLLSLLFVLPPTSTWYACNFSINALEWFTRCVAWSAIGVLLDGVSFWLERRLGGYEFELGLDEFQRFGLTTASVAFLAFGMTMALGPILIADTNAPFMGNRCYEDARRQWY